MGSPSFFKKLFSYEKISTDYLRTFTMCLSVLLLPGRDRSDRKSNNSK